MDTQKPIRMSWWQRLRIRRLARGMNRCEGELRRLAERGSGAHDKLWNYFYKCHLGKTKWDMTEDEVKRLPSYTVNRMTGRVEYDTDKKGSMPSALKDALKNLEIRVGMRTEEDDEDEPEVLH